MIVETVQAEGGVIVASVEWIQQLRAVCDQQDSPLICDDIQVGCCRTGAFFLCERAGIVPDLVTRSKSVSGYGLPVSLLAWIDRHMRYQRPSATRDEPWGRVRVRVLLGSPSPDSLPHVHQMLRVCHTLLLLSLPLFQVSQQPSKCRLMGIMLFPLPEVASHYTLSQVDVSALWIAIMWLCSAACGCFGVDTNVVFTRSRGSRQTNLRVEAHVVRDDVHRRAVHAHSTAGADRTHVANLAGDKLHTIIFP